MKTLAIDTSLASGSVAALADGRVEARCFEPPANHARLLAAALADVAGRLGWRPRDAELVAVIRGPGSFTGLRVGVATAKALAWTSGARLVGVSAFEVVARRTAGLVDCGGRPVSIAFDAGRGAVFAATADTDTESPTGWRVGPGGLLAATDWIASLPAGGWATGPALEKLAPELATRPEILVPPAESWLPSAAEAGAIAAARAAAGESDDPFTLVPEYLRPSYADEKAGPPPER